MVSFFLSCGGKTESDLVLETIDEISNHAEDRDADGVLFYISMDYLDDKERTIDDIEKLLKEYVVKYRGIVINVLATKILNITVPNAEIETDVSLSSGAAQLLRKAVRYAGHYYRFHFKLIKEGEKWRIKEASWKYIDLDDLFPESLEILK